LAGKSEESMGEAKKRTQFGWGNGGGKMPGLMVSLRQRFQKKIEQNAKLKVYVNKARQKLRLNLRFLRVKKELLFKWNPKQKFPYDEYSSYL
jgi:hypothetical protein